MRYERKYRIENIDKGIVEQAILLHPYAFRKAFLDRQVNNIYFDTASQSTYQDNVAGIAVRRKFRVRWYGAIKPEVKAANLEVKHKNNLLGTKDTKPIAPFDLNELDTLTAAVNQMNLIHTPLTPSLSNSYQRAYYESFDRRFRITIDWQIYTSSPAQMLCINSGKMESGVIVELKYPQNLDKLAKELMQFLPFRITKNSKYVNGMDLLYS